MSSHDQPNQGPLRGIRVLDASSVVAGPVACQLLGDYGAEVIKVEHPVHGDSMRMHGPAKDGVPLWWKIVSRNKRSVGMYLGDPEVAEIFRRLAGTTDVLVENFRPGTLERWGLGYDQLREANPGLVLVRISGFGQSGPYARRPAFGTMAESMSTFAHITGPADAPPTLPPFGLADNIAGMAAASATLMALVDRYRNGGEGQVIDLSILEPIMMTLGFQVIWYDQLGIVETRRGNRSVNSAPRNTYRTKDGEWVALAASTTSTAHRLMQLIERPDLAAQPWFESNGQRAQHAAELDAAIGQWLATRTRDEAMAAFRQAEVAAAPIYDIAELVADEQVQALEMVTRVPDADLGPVLMPNVVFRMSGTPGGIRFTGQPLGAATDQVLVDELGVPAEQVARLRERGVVA